LERSAAGHHLILLLLDVVLQRLGQTIETVSSSQLLMISPFLSDNRSEGTLLATGQSNSVMLVSLLQQQSNWQSKPWWNMRWAPSSWGVCGLLHVRSGGDAAMRQP
jgi:hypothetical protein